MDAEEPDFLSESYGFDDFVLDCSLRELRGPDGRVEVQRKVLLVLFYLARNCERVVGKDELLDAVWPGTVVTESVLSRAIMKARTAVGDDSAGQRVIRTVHGHGYRFEAEVRLLTSRTASTSPPQFEPRPAAPSRTDLPAISPALEPPFPEPGSAAELAAIERALDEDPEFAPLPSAAPARPAPSRLAGTAGWAVAFLAALGVGAAALFVFASGGI